MTKAEVQALVETNDKLQRWAAVLFAEICELVQTQDRDDWDIKAVYPIIAGKVKEFERMVLMEAIKRAEEKLKAQEENPG